MDWNHWVALALLAAAAWALKLRLARRAQTRALRAWPEVAGSVLSHAIEKSSQADSDGGIDTVYSPRLGYRYEAGGQLREGTRLALEGISFDSERKAHAWLAARPVGAPIAVYVNPADPSDAVVTRDASSDWWVPVFLAGLAAATAAGVFG